MFSFLEYKLRHLIYPRLADEMMTSCLTFPFHTKLRIEDFEEDTASGTRMVPCLPVDQDWASLWRWGGWQLTTVVTFAVSQTSARIVRRIVTTWRQSPLAALPPLHFRHSAFIDQFSDCGCAYFPFTCQGSSSASYVSLSELWNFSLC